MSIGRSEQSAGAASPARFPGKRESSWGEAERGGDRLPGRHVWTFGVSFSVWVVQLPGQAALGMKST